jgi:hypothetical protein
MMSKKDVLDLIVLECQLCKQLFKKLPKGKMNYRPGKKMRSTLELLRYISFCGTECSRMMLLDAFKTQNWAAYEKAAKKAETLSPGKFSSAMDAQIRDLKKLYGGISAKEFARKVKMPYGKPLPLGEALLNTAGRFMSGYRMQLFLYAKASGNNKIGTKECWFL